MTTRVDEIAPGIFRLSTWVAGVAPPRGFTFNQFLLTGDEPLLYHCGHRTMFPALAGAVARILPVERLRWIAFGHVEADESGAMNTWLEAAPRAQVAHGGLGCQVSIADMAIRPPRALADGEAIEIGGLRVRHLDTPHVPHGWDARALYEETTATLLCGDLFTHLGDGPAITAGDVLGPALEAEDIFGATALTPATAPTLRRMAELKPRRLALMHGSSFEGDGAGALLGLAEAYEARLRAAG